MRFAGIVLIAVTKAIAYGNNETNEISNSVDDGFPNGADDKSVWSPYRKTVFYLYTRKNNDIPQELNPNDESSIRFSNFDPRLETVVVSHGWLGGLEQSLNPTTRDAFLNKKEVNVIIVDWGRTAHLDYVTSSNYVPEVGTKLGKFLAFLRKTTGASFEKMHLVGHSLGAHVVGIAGRYNNGKIARITGLDPAGPLWEFNSQRLSQTDASYVECIYTNGGAIGLYGTKRTLCRINFYPNGGSSQPGCSTNVCNHSRSWKLFAASITFDKFIATGCSTTLQWDLGICRGGELAMGNDSLNKTGGRSYYLKTTATYPYFIFS